MANSDERVMEILASAKKLAQEYRAVTGKPMGVTGEVAEYEAARLLGLELTPARNEGYDAIERAAGQVRRLQIKGRCLQPDAKPGQRIGRIDTNKGWDAALLVILNENFEATAIYEASHKAVSDALDAPGSISRNERRQLGVSKFKAIGKRVWP